MKDCSPWFSSYNTENALHVFVLNSMIPFNLVFKFLLF